MPQKKIISLITIFFVLGLSAQKEQLTGSEQTVQKKSGQESVLDAVSHITDIQALIMGYVGQFEFRDRTDKVICTANLLLSPMQKLALITREYGSRAYSEIDEYLSMSLLAREEDVSSLDGKWVVRSRVGKPSPITVSKDKKIVRTIAAQEYIGQISISSDNLYLMSYGFNIGEQGMNTQIYNLETGELLYTLICTGKHEIKPRFSPDGKYIAYADTPSRIVLVDSSTYKFVTDIICPSISVLAFSDDGKTLVTVSISESDEFLRFYEKKVHPLWVTK